MLNLTKRQDGVSRKKVTMWIILILLAGTALRLYRLDFQSLRNDELSSWARSQHNTLQQVIDRGAIPDCHPPGYYIMLHYIIRIFGDSEIALRGLSVLTGILSIFLTFLLGKQLFSSGTGLFAAALMAFMYNPIYYSRDARMYSPLMLFTLAAAYFTVCISMRMKKHEPVPSRYIGGLVICATAASYVHYFGLLFVLLLLGLFSLKSLRAHEQPFFLFSGLVIVITYLPWWREFFNDLTASKAIGIPVRLKTIASFANFMFHGVYLLLAVCVLLVATAVVLLRREPRLRSRDLLLSRELGLAAWILIPFGFVFIKSLLFAPTYANYTLIFCLPPAYLLVSRAIERVSSRGGVRITILLALLTLSLAHTIYGESFYTRAHKQQFKQATRVIADHEADVPNAIVIAYAWSNLYIDYYLKKFGSRHRVDLVAGKAEDIPRLKELLSGRAPEYIWFINAHRVPEDAFVR